MASLLCTHPPEQGGDVPVFGRFTPGMGRSYRHSRGVRPVEPGGVSVPHQPAGDGIGLSVPAEIRANSEGHACDCLRGQCLMPCLFPQPRGHYLTKTVPSSREDPCLGSQPSDHHLHRVRSREAECSRRSAQSAQSGPSDRMDDCSSSIGTGVVALGQADDRPLRDEVQPETSSVHLPDERPVSAWQRRLRQALVESGGVCVPSNESSSKGPRQIRSRETENDFGRALLASSSVVSRPSRSRVRGPTVPRSLRKDSTPASVRHREPTRSPPQPDRLATITQGLAASGLSAASVRLALQARRSSTDSNYNCKWITWCSWCDARDPKVEPLRPLPRNLADFLAFLYTEKGLSHPTLCNYRSAIANTVRSTRGIDTTFLVEGPQVKLVLDGIKSEFPRKQISIPPWDLFVILRYLQSDKFEPLTTASLLHVTRKTLFLVMLACARRISGIHAFSGLPRDISFDRRSGSCFLKFLPEFRAKNQDALITNDPIEIQSLRFVANQDTDSLTLCPVRMIKHYLIRTREFRKNKRRFFVPLSLARNKDVSKNSLAKWLRELILGAYTDANLPPPNSASRTHEIRKISTSVGFAKNLSISALMRAAYWKTEDTFIGHYLRDVRVDRHDDTFGISEVVVAGRAIAL